MINKTIYNPDSNESINDRNFAFTIFTNPANDDYDEQNAFLALSEELGFKIIARIKHDSNQQNHLLTRAFKVSSVKSSKVGPITSQELYGYRFTGAFVKHRPLIVDPKDWLDAPEVCS